MKLALAAVALLAAHSALAEDVTIKTDKGVVKGVREDHEHGQYYYAFKGIRYAKPPTGNLRFKVRTSNQRKREDTSNLIW